jgi:dihydroflavonol-4-reductase
MRAFVTGATGFIGYHVAKALRDEGHDVRALVRSPAGAGRLASLGVETVYGDLRTGQGLERIRGCDAVFHVAAHYSLARRDRTVMYETNVEGTRRLLAAVRLVGGPRLVYTSSTATVALREDGQPADERGFVDPETVESDYKKTKVLAERLVLAACQEGMDIVIVNPSTPVGWGDVKPTPTGRIILDVVRGRMPGYADTGLNVIAVEDVAAGHLLAFARGRPGERYILGHENMHFRHLVATVARLAGRRPPRMRVPLWLAYSVAAIDEYVITPIVKSGPRVPLAGVKLARKPMYFSAEKAVRELGLPQTPVTAALGRAVEWFSGEFAKHSAERTGTA